MSIWHLFCTFLCLTNEDASVFASIIFFVVTEYNKTFFNDLFVSLQYKCNKKCIDFR